jgi:ORF6N domain
MKPKPSSGVPVERITERIYLIRSTKVMLDRDLAGLYEVETRALKQAVRRNIERFPPDFMFELTAEELQNWRSQFVTSIAEKMGLRHSPMAFTEQGVAMLSSVLHSRRAIQVNIQIMRAFTGLRRMLSGYAELRNKIEKMEEKYDQNFQVVFAAIQQLLEVEARPKRRIGFTGGKAGTFEDHEADRRQL